MIAGIVVAVGFCLFLLRLFGAGDIKFAVVIALWFGVGSTGDFLTYAGLLGGVVSLPGNPREAPALPSFRRPARPREGCRLPERNSRLSVML